MEFLYACNQLSNFLVCLLLDTIRIRCGDLELRYAGAIGSKSIGRRPKGVVRYRGSCGAIQDVVGRPCRLHAVLGRVEDARGAQWLGHRVELRHRTTNKVEDHAP